MVTFRRAQRAVTYLHPEEIELSQSTWVFGYGSLIWRPDFEFLESAVAHLPGFARRFWQGSHDHRGTPDAPGRVVTLVTNPSARCVGIAYRLDTAVVTETFEALDFREKNGYERNEVTLELADGRNVAGLVYVGADRNFAWLGEAALPDMASQIAHSVGPSGRNADYLFNLADALRELQVQDEHVFELESAVRQVLNDGR